MDRPSPHGWTAAHYPNGGRDQTHIDKSPFCGRHAGLAQLVMNARQRSIYELEREVDFSLALAMDDAFGQRLFPTGTHGRSPAGHSLRDSQPR